MARPTILTKELKEQARLYIEECEDHDDEYHKTRGEKSDGYERLVKVKLPTIEGLAYFLGTSRDILYDWETKDKEFSYIMEDLRAKQADTLINKGLSGDYNPTIAKVLLTKHGYRDGTEIMGKDGEKLIESSLTKEEKDKLLGLLK